MVIVLFCKKIDISGLGCIGEILPTGVVQVVPPQDIVAQG